MVRTERRGALGLVSFLISFHGEAYPCLGFSFHIMYRYPLGGESRTAQNKTQHRHCMLHTKGACALSLATFYLSVTI